MRIVDGWASCASAVEYLPPGPPLRGGTSIQGPALDHAGDIKLCQVGPCRPRRRGRGTLGLPCGVEKQGYPPGLLVEDGPREPSAPCPMSYAPVTLSQKRITAPPVFDENISGRKGTRRTERARTSAGYSCTVLPPSALCLRSGGTRTTFSAGVKHAGQ